MPTAQTELFGTTHGRRAADLTDMTEFRVVLNQSALGLAGATLTAQFSVDNGANWINLESGGPVTDLDVGVSTGLNIGAWGNLDALAADDVQLRFVGQDGNGSTDPVFRYIGIEFR